MMLKSGKSGYSIIFIAILIVIILLSGCINQNDEKLDTIEKRVDMLEKENNDLKTQIEELNKQQTTPTSFSTVSLDSIANSPIDHLSNPILGNVNLGGVPFLLKRAFLTQQRFLLENPNRGVINLNVTSPLKIYILLNGAYVLKQFFEKEVGYIEMEFNDGTSFKKSIVAGKDLRETWAGDENLYTISSISNNFNWQNVWSETQSRGGKPATAFIDMLTIPLPQEFQSRTLTKISIYDSSNDYVGSYDPSLFVMGITVEYNSKN